MSKHSKHRPTFHFKPSYELKMKILGTPKDLINNKYNDHYDLYGTFVLEFGEDERNILEEVIKWSQITWPVITETYKCDIKPFKGLFPLSRECFIPTMGKVPVRFSFDVYDGRKGNWKEWFIMDLGGEF